MAQYLRKIGRTYYFRIAVPASIQDHPDYNKKEVLKSLKTTSARIAQRKALLMATEYHQRFSEMSEPPTPEPQNENELHAIIAAQQKQIDAQQKQMEAFIQAMALSQGQSLPSISTTSLQSAFEAYANSKRWKDKGRIQQRYQREIDFFQRVNGPLRVGDITHDHLDGYAEALRDYPADYKSNMKASLDEYIAQNPRYKRISEPQRKNKYQLILAVLSYCKRRLAKEIDQHLDLSPLVIDKSKNGERLEKHAFTLEDVVGFLTHHTWSIPRFDDDLHYWAPLISLYTGLRTGEVVQLSKTDIIENDGLLILNVQENWEGQSIKNENAFRQIPLHPELVDGLNFRRFWDLSSFRLFPSCWTGKNVRGERLQKFFHQEVLPQTIGKSKRQSFYCIRHFVENHAAHCELPQNKIDYLMGHSSKTSAMSDHYGRSNKIYAWYAEYIEKYSLKSVLDAAGVKPYASTRRLKHVKKRGLPF